MIRLGLYITLAIFLALCAVWFADNPGNLQLNWRGWEIRMSVAVFGLLIFLYTVSCWYLFKLYRWFRTDNPLASPKRMASRREKGLAELDLGWSALAIHDKAAALKHGRKAYSLLPADNGPARLLLQASGDKKYLAQLNDSPGSKMLAMTFRLKKELKADNSKNAHEILVEMQKSNPGNSWISQKLFDILTRLGKWAEATEELGKLVKAKAMDSGEYKRLSAVLCYRQALEADLAGQKKSARDFGEQALKKDLSFIPAALLLGRHHLAEGDKARARKIIENTWKVAPHPDLGQFFLKLEPLESPSEKFRRIQKFTGLNAEHPHSRHLLAKIALDTEHWAEAKQALDRLVKTDRASHETYHLLARLEMLQKQDEKASEAHMTSASNAPPDPMWQCAKCGTSRENYTATCPNCHSFGQIRWQEQL
ncbi:MAG: hypothetical protein COB49_02910 [Alphaproteobacteria bacterium]|nr:MAG: hypothetical protein COB49_02910 [Alphaproteobacteria bacterium]